MPAGFMRLSYDIAGNIQNHKNMLRIQVVRGLIDRNGGTIGNRFHSTVKY